MAVVGIAKMSPDRLLIIDDDKDVGDVLTELAGEHDFEARHVDNFDAVRQLIAEWSPTAIITDLQMPKVDGVAVIRYLAREKCRARLGIISGLDGRIAEVAEAVARDRGLNVVGRIQKPFDICALGDFLERLRGPSRINLDSLSRALSQDQIDVHFQPKCSTANGAIIGAEALIRWDHPQWGAVPPEQLVAFAEKHGMADAVLDHVVVRSLKALDLWNRSGVTVPLAINMTPANLENLCLPDRMDALCEVYACDPGRITFELTEKSSMDSGADALDVLTRLRIKGFRLSIDDFGTGFSSLLRLRQMPFSELKIDRSFVVGVTNSNDSAIIVKTIAAMAQNLALDCVAEGVESGDLATTLGEWGCAVGQGFHYAKAMPPERFLTWAGPHSRVA